MCRFADAIAIQQGACNPIAIVNSLKKGIDEVRGDRLLPTQEILGDPALRLIVHQLAHLFQVNDEHQMIGGEYNRLVSECEKHL